MSVSIDDFRAAMSRWTSGITVITVRHDDVTHGMVASSFAGVSTDPVTVLFCADHATRTYPLLKKSGAFVVNILAEDQAETFRVFAGQKGERDASKFEGEEVITAATGAPILAKSLAWFDCHIVAEHPGGNTHSIFVGEVVASDLGAGADHPPLVYFRRKVRRLELDDD
ncbi:MAG: flavin reductase [Chloroflexi bacterium]|nr:flavin reductase [Chloroflexota bacterium]